MTDERRAALNALLQALNRETSAWQNTVGQTNDEALRQAAHAALLRAKAHAALVTAELAQG